METTDPGRETTDDRLIHEEGLVRETRVPTMRGTRHTGHAYWSESKSRARDKVAGNNHPTPPNKLQSIQHHAK
ncbi:hypothetical protein E2C01_036363 [Portunus trituberculatus]|uniref:Uncharacterized protein n=1 Tax=Portunus trituberculatus TaxID=210409 RepID=A0A5B7FC92_PORTR|nr:hypothetical protein [Portunus trituberculatus]